jgi:hypothetical protein
MALVGVISTQLWHQMFVAGTGLETGGLPPRSDIAIYDAGEATT